MITLDSLNKIYSFVHNLEVSHCQHFKTNEAQIISETTNSLQIEQYYTNANEVVMLHHEISVDEGVLWAIKRHDPFSEPYVGCRFGITIPIDSNKVMVYNNEVAPPIINYNQHWDHSYSGQIDVDIPVIKIQLWDDQYYVMITPEENVQFFVFEDNGYWLKIVTMGNEDISLTIAIRPVIEQYKKTYLSIFPLAESYLFRAKNIFCKIESQFDITVATHQFVDSGSLHSIPPTQNEMEEYAEILYEQLSFYPEGFFKKIKLRQLSICGNISDGKNVINGRRNYDNILLNVSLELSYYTRIKTIHHELFHLLMNILPDKYDNEENMAKLFSSFIIDPTFTEYLCNKDLDIAKQTKIVLNIFTSLGEEYKSLIEFHTNYTESPPLVNIYAKEKIDTSPKKEYALTGLRHTCWSWVEAQTDAQDFFPVAELEIQQILKSNFPILCTTINPLDYCACEYVQSSIPVEKSLQTWIEVHKQLEFKVCYYFHSEKLLMLDVGYIKSFFRNFGLFINEEHIYEYKQEIRPYPLDSIPMLKRSWARYRTLPIIVRMGYNTTSSED